MSEHSSPDAASRPLPDLLSGLPPISKEDSTGSIADDQQRKGPEVDVRGLQNPHHDVIFNSPTDPPQPGHRRKRNRMSSDRKPERQQWKRALWCLGWILLCPVFGCLYLLRESPADEDDLHEDECLPCYS